MTAPITCTWAEAARLDETEANLLALWSETLTDGHSPYFVAALITAAVDYDPRLGMHMDACTRHGCSTLVDETARDQHGRLFCTDSCRDAHAECADAHLRHALLVDGRYDVRRRVA